MINYLIRLAVCGVLVFLMPKYLNDIEVSSLEIGFLVAVCMSLLNTFVKPVLKLVSFPVTIMTLGLFSFVITIAVVYICDHFIDGFEVSGIVGPLVFSFVLSITNSILGFFLKKSK